MTAQLPADYSGTIKEIAGFRRVALSTAWKWKKEGRFKTWQMSRNVRVPEPEIIRVFASAGEPAEVLRRNWRAYCDRTRIRGKAPMTTEVAEFIRQEVARQLAEKLAA